MGEVIARALLVGNLTRDPELRHTQSGMAVCTLGVAVNQREKVNGEWADYASFFDAVCFGNQAEACAEHLSKGSQVGVDGRLRQDRWEAKDGTKRNAVKIMIDTIQFLGKRDGDGQQTIDRSAPAASGDFQAPAATFTAPDADFGQPADDDIPF